MQMLRWQKGYAMDCRSIQPGSIPGSDLEDLYGDEVKRRLKVFLPPKYPEILLKHWKK